MCQLIRRYTLSFAEVAIPQARARSFIANKKGMAERGEAPNLVVTDPPRPRAFKARLRESILTQIGEVEPLCGPVFMNLVFYLPKPVSKPAWKRWPDVRPDLDNYEKIIKDAMNGDRKTRKGRVLKDDGIVVWVNKMKMYAEWNDGHTHFSVEPHIEVELYSIEELRPEVKKKGEIKH